MPTSTTTTTTRTVIVCFPAGTDADWFTASEVIEHHLNTPAPRSADTRSDTDSCSACSADGSAPTCSTHVAASAP